MYYGQLEEILEFVYTPFKDDQDVLHDNNSSHLALSAKLNYLNYANLNIDGQSIEEAPPPPVILIDNNNNFIDEEDDDLADYDMGQLAQLATSYC
ncbi:hypothetical protein Tco_0867962 [Tanacetum coccineum]